MKTCNCSVSIDTQPQMQVNDTHTTCAHLEIKTPISWTSFSIFSSEACKTIDYTYFTTNDNRHSSDEYYRQKSWKKTQPNAEKIIFTMIMHDSALSCMRFNRKVNGSMCVQLICK